MRAPGVDPLALGAELGEALGLDVDVLVVEEDLGVPLLEALVRDGIVVCERRPGAGALWRVGRSRLDQQDARDDPDGPRSARDGDAR